MEALALGKTLEERRLVWPQLQARLALAGINKEDSAKAKSYFLRGREPTIKVHGESFMDDDPMPLVIPLWLHPDTSDASMCAIFERVLAYPHNGVITRSMRESKRLLDQIASTHHFNGVDAPHGWPGTRSALRVSCWAAMAVARRIPIGGTPRIQTPVVRFTTLMDLARFITPNCSSGSAMPAWKQCMPG